MEVHARYTLMGLFALAVIGTGFAFVYWLEVGGGFAERVSYRVQFADQVAGLSKGSAVLFNGVRVGEVTRLDLHATSPSDVTVLVAVDRSAPVRADTKAGIEFQGLAGAPAIALAGGSQALPLLASANADARMLKADKDAGQTMTQSVRDVLRNIDKVITDNADPLRSAISSIDKFTGALARNSDKVDGILSGLERLTGGGAKPAVRIIELRPATTFPQATPIPKGFLQIPEPTALAHLETDKILLSDSDKAKLENVQWPDVLPRVVQAGLVRSFENAGYRRVLGRAPDGAKADYQLLVDIRRFQFAPSPAPVAEIEIGVRILRGDGNVSEVHVFEARVPAAGLQPQAAADALNEAFGKVSVAIVTWACGSL